MTGRDSLEALAWKRGGALPRCGVCTQPKPPVGRSVPLEASASYCGHDCAGYQMKPVPPHTWPGELPLFLFASGEDIRALTGALRAIAFDDLPRHRCHEIAQHALTAIGAANVPDATGPGGEG